MGHVLTLPGIGKATTCKVSTHHAPTPLRFVWHHILPQEAGGKTEFENLIQCCDNDHYAIHALMYQIAQNNGQFTTLKRFAGTRRAQVAQQGYQAALAAGTVDKIPNEGSA